MLQGAVTIWYRNVAPTGFSMHFVLLTMTLLNSAEVLDGLLKTTFNKLI